MGGDSQSDHLKKAPVNLSLQHATNSEGEGSGGGSGSSSTPNELLNSLTWLLPTETTVHRGQLLAHYTTRHQTHSVHATCSGVLIHRGMEETRTEVVDVEKRIKANAMPVTTDTITIGWVQYCTHPIRNKNVCMMCLQRVDAEEADDQENQMVDVMFAHGQTIRMHSDAADHTLLHATQSSQAEKMTHPDIHRFNLTNSGGQQTQHYVKLRPHLLEFLNGMLPYYDMYIYTHGTREYALNIVHIIDPDGTLFAQRIVARTDTPGLAHKNLKLLFPSCIDSMILILDDRLDVWRDNPWNVLLLEPYHFFYGMEDVNNASGGGGLMDSKDMIAWSKDRTMEEHFAMDAKDTQLRDISTVLIKVHATFYALEQDAARLDDGNERKDQKKGIEEKDKDERLVSNSSTTETRWTFEDQVAGRGPDVKSILGQIQKSILQDCYIVFSGVFQVGRAPPQKHPLWKMASNLGAKVSLGLEPTFPITHLVLHRDRIGTDKHRQALQMKNVCIVDPSWVAASAKQWRRCNENDFAIAPEPRLPTPVPPLSRPSETIFSLSTPTDRFTIEKEVGKEIEKVENVRVDKTEKAEMKKVEEKKEKNDEEKEESCRSDASAFSAKMPQTSQRKPSLRSGDPSQGTAFVKKSVHFEALTNSDDLQRKRSLGAKEERKKANRLTCEPSAVSGVKDGGVSPAVALSISRLPGSEEVSSFLGSLTRGLHAPKRSLPIKTVVEVKRQKQQSHGSSSSRGGRSFGRGRSHATTSVESNEDILDRLIRAEENESEEMGQQKQQQQSTGSHAAPTSSSLHKSVGKHALFAERLLAREKAEKKKEDEEEEDEEEEDEDEEENEGRQEEKQGSFVTGVGLDEDEDVLLEDMERELFDL